jgi:hypothetical protein
MSEQKIDEMIKILRSLKTDIKKLNKLSSKDLTQMTQRQISNRNADAGFIGMSRIKKEHELHALAVELGFSPRRESYDEVNLTDGWQRYSYKPREPK